MRKKPETVMLLVGLACVGLSVGALILVRTMGDNGRGSPGSTDPFTQAKAQALDEIRKREDWPESPKAVCEAFWQARERKDYAEMQILWPGTAALNWPDLCKNDVNTVYVFGEPAPDGTRVPYAEKGYFETHGTYNLAMLLGVLETGKGTRHYIVSGNSSARDATNN